MQSKLLLQFYRGQSVPPLVNKKQSSRGASNSNSPKSKPKPKSPFHRFRSPSHHSLQSRETIQQERSPQHLLPLTQQLHKQSQQNQQLRAIIAEITQKSQTLQEMNQQLIARVTEIDKQLISQAEAHGLEKRTAESRIKTSVYAEIQEFLRSSIERFMDGLRKQRMSPIVQNKIQCFLEEILNVNGLLVDKYSLREDRRRGEAQPSQEGISQALKEILDQRQSLKKTTPSAEKGKYSAIIEKLNAGNASAGPRNAPREQERSRSPSFMDIGMESRQMSRVRPKIFNKEYATENKNKSTAH